MSQDRQPLPTPLVYGDPVSARARFHQLGLKPEQLQAGLRYGIAERRNLTANDPLWLWGILTTGKITRGLRDQLVQAGSGWKISNRMNYATVVHPDDLLAIAVSSADGDAGDPFGHPSTRAEKGIATELAVKSNQAGFHSIMPSDFPAPKPSMPTYLLLYNYDDDTGIVGAELSLPIGISDDGLIRAWQERIPLFPSPLDPVARVIDDDADGGGGADIDIEVERRAS